MIIKIIEHDSAEYDQMISLRVHTLLEPIGVPASYINREKEREDILIGAFEDNKIIGCCVLSRRDNSLLQLRQMAVRKDVQNKKIGLAILQFAEAKAKELGFTTLMMHARDVVIDFYKKGGYEVFDEPFFEVGVSHHKMRKEL